MARRRKVGNLLGLAVLSAVVERPMHPYEMASVLRERGKDRDMQIKWGSLYTVVSNLEKHGLLEATESHKQGGRPERTIYRLTDAGRAELEDWVREILSTPEPEVPRFEAVLSVLGVLGPDDVIDLLRQRLDRLEAQITAQRESLAEAGREVPRLFLVESEYDLAIRTAEATWVRGLVDQLVTGSMPGIDQWRTWHETGQLPPEVKALAERGHTTD